MKSTASHTASLFIALALQTGSAVVASIDPTYAPNLAISTTSPWANFSY